MMNKARQDIAKALRTLEPLQQAERCLDIWLKENRRRLPRDDRARVAGLMARYFHYEDTVTDQLMLSFLRHYSGQREIDMEDPTSVRMEIKAILDRTTARPSYFHPIAFAAVVGAIVTMLSFFLWDMSQLTVTPRQQEALRAKVERIASRDPGVSRAAVWSRIKKPLSISRYENISYWDYDDAEKMLDDWLARLNAVP